MTGRAFRLISGLPRSGSTPLSAILRRNPDVHVASPVGSLAGAVPNEIGASHAGAVSSTQARRGALPRGLFDADREMVASNRLRPAPGRHRQPRPDARALRRRRLRGSTAHEAEFALPSAALEPAAA